MDPRGARQRLDALWRRGTEFLGVETAILCGAMTWVSERNLVSALSNAGGFGVLACGAMGPDLLDQEIAATQSLTDRPFGVNLIVMHPELDALIAVCRERKAPHVILAGGLPSQRTIASVKEGGAKVTCFAATLGVCRRLIRLGADAIVVEGAEAGGHIGPVATGVLAQEILPHVREVPVFIAGGIGRGETIVAYLEMGASGCQLGTRFVCATEAITHPDVKRAYIRAAARDAMPTVQLDPDFPVIPVRALRNEGTEEFHRFQRETIARVRAGEVAQEAAQLDIEHFWAGALRRGVIEGDVARGSLMAGQSVGMVEREQPVKEILDELIGQAVAAILARDGARSGS